MARFMEKRAISSGMVAKALSSRLSPAGRVGKLEGIFSQPGYSNWKREVEKTKRQLGRMADSFARRANEVLYPGASWRAGKFRNVPFIKERANRARDLLNQ